ncbi:MAG TPA: FAD-binding oxidoreductase [Geminicoccus sp.]|jgi:decaprenylphospho-beta-D-ribofuranose 2-oxidase|uniref:FAD-binding oxidoreductase n=1 Tax=Geminicoccus sp. TaxID=2024832 RepID=UPI002E33CEE6|nr:FAD-binding oxidoreductase [Geminicoccus sp.]HEX2526489.1 FAD-binding oxidoreductase [Geminicoccus sp.]
MTAWKSMEVSGWGRVPTTRAEVARPERDSQLRQIVREADGPLLTLGAGRSYGDVGQPVEGGRGVLATRLDRITAFDADIGRITVEPGVTFADLHRHLLPRGWLAPVCPGTAFATIAGALANDVHGKNQGAAGSFGDHVDAFTLLSAKGESRSITRTSDPDLFRATIGGLGLTGMITSVSFTLVRVPSNAVLVQEQRIGDLDSFLAAFEAKKDAHFSVGWIDALSKGRQFGRGLLETAELVSPGLPPAPAKSRTVPFDLPAVAMSPLSTRMFNAAWWRRVPADGRSRLVPIPAFLHPLDGLHQWNRIYGKRGFRQFQCVVPFDDGRATLIRLLEEVARHGHASFLAVLKAFGRSGPGMLSFCMPGWTLALDFPERPGVQELLARLETITRDAGGRIYLAKDSHLSAEGFASMYPALGQFRQVLDRVDPDGRWQSGLARRLRIREGGSS